MSEPKFTPGPWKAIGRTICPKNQLDPLNTEIVCRIHENRFASREEANASLIAAAPEMYDLLERLPSDIRHLLQSGNTDMCKRIVGKIDAILMEAGGER